MFQPLVTPSPGTAWSTLVDEVGPGFGFGSTADAGIGWSGRWFTGDLRAPPSAFPPATCVATTAYDARHA